AYTVSGIGNTDAEKIAYRALTVYFTPNTDYLESPQKLKIRVIAYLSE
ncbi:MAG: M4 family metallopeptidase, partial [Cytophagales bacterium]